MGLSKYSLVQSDVIEWSNQYDGAKFHALFCDPPYHLTSITKRFGKANSTPAKGDVYRRSSTGFIGTTWDGLDESGQGIAFQPETWEALGQHLYPGGFGMAFASTRGVHRMACAIEDAGLIIHPTIYLWAFLSGFPKATRIDTQIDKAAGNVRPDKLNGGHIGMGKAAGDSNNDNEIGGQVRHVIGKGNLTNGTPIDPLAQAWAGHRYGLQALKPAVEPIVCFQRPYEGRPVDNITQTGAGAWNIDGGRIATDDNTKRYNNDTMGYGGCNVSFAGGGHSAGRWPSNLVLQHSPDCAGDCVDGCPVKALDEQSGNRAGGSPNTGNEPSESTKNTYGKRNRVAFPGYDDSGPASRMFYRADWSYEVAEQIANGDTLRYEPKAGSSEREAGLGSLPTKTRNRVNAGGLENEPRFAPTQVKNNHPTVKSISLTKYLATLLLPPAGYHRRILVPFAGVGSEMIGSMLAGWDEVIGIERESPYVEIANARLDWWSQWPGWGQTDVDKILKGETVTEQLSFI